LNFKNKLDGLNPSIFLNGWIEFNPLKKIVWWSGSLCHHEGFESSHVVHHALISAIH